MADFARLRQQMLDTQLRTSQITDKPLLARMGELPREMFVPPGRQVVAYADDNHIFGAAGSGRVMLSPAVFAKLAQLVAVKASDAILDIDICTGYSTAVLAGLGDTVVGIEKDATLARLAVKNLAALGRGNATVLESPDTITGTFDVIFVGRASGSVATDLLARLNDGGRLVALVQKGAVAVATLHTKSAGRVVTRTDFSVALPPNGVAREPVEFIF